MLDKLVDKTLEAVVNAVLKKVFEDYDADDVIFAVEKNLSLLKIIEMGILDYKERGDKWRPENRRRYKHFLQALKVATKLTTKMPTIVDDFVTTENTLAWLKENRPDLYEVLSTERGREWLEISIAQIRLLLKGKIKINEELIPTEEVEGE